MNYIQHARLGTGSSVDFPTGAEQPRGRAADDRMRRMDSRIVLGGCALLLSLIGVSSTIRALDLRAPSGCVAFPAQLKFGAETATRIETGSGAACTVAVQTGAATIEDLTVTSVARHGSITPRGRTGVVYRPQGNYRGEDSFTLALRGRSETQQGVAIVRVRVDVK